MNEKRLGESYNSSSQPTVDDGEINLLDFFFILVSHKKFIFLSCLITFIFSCGIVFVLPDTFTATARILPPQEEKRNISQFMAGISELAYLAGLSDSSGSAGLYVGMLKSRTVTEGVIESLNLSEHFEWETRIGAYQELKGMVQVSIGKNDGIIDISIDDQDPDRAAAIVNTYIEELKKLNVKLNLSTAGRQRAFLEERLDLVKTDLAKAEEALKEFQTANKAIRIDAQTSAIIEAIARLKGELASKEVELGVLMSSQTEQNPQVKALREEISQVKNQIRQLEQSSEGKNVAGDIFISTSEVPELGLKYARLLREFKVQETLFELLTKQYEVAKFEEAKNTSFIQVLDPAIPPDVKSKPKRKLIVLLVTVCAGFLSVIFVFFSEYLKRLNEEDRRRLQALRRALGFKNSTGLKPEKN